MCINNCILFVSISKLFIQTNKFYNIQFIAIALLDYNCRINRIIATFLLLQYINCNIIKQMFTFIYIILLLTQTIDRNTLCIINKK